MKRTYKRAVLVYWYCRLAAGVLGDTRKFKSLLARVPRTVLRCETRFASQIAKETTNSVAKPLSQRLAYHAQCELDRRARVSKGFNIY